MIFLAELAFKSDRLLVILIKKVHIKQFYPMVLFVGIEKMVNS